MNANNNAALRDVLESIKDSIECVLQTISTSGIDSEAIVGWCNATIRRINEAFATPPRACDVMPAERLAEIATKGMLSAIEARKEELASIDTKTLVQIAVASAIQCAYDTQLVRGGE